MPIGKDFTTMTVSQLARVQTMGQKATREATRNLVCVQISDDSTTCLQISICLKPMEDMTVHQSLPATNSAVFFLLFLPVGEFHRKVSGKGPATLPTK